MPVVVGFVPTPEGKAALRRALIECQMRATNLIVVSAEHTSGPAMSPDPAAEEVRAGCTELGFAQSQVEIRRNSNAYEPADDVLSVAEESAAELIVIGLRRRTAVGKLILGGSAQRILLDASCPVLAVKVDRAFGQPMTEPGSIGQDVSVLPASQSDVSVQEASESETSVLPASESDVSVQAASVSDLSVPGASVQETR